MNFKGNLSLCSNTLCQLFRLYVEIPPAFEQLLNSNVSNKINHYIVIKNIVKDQRLLTVVHQMVQYTSGVNVLKSTSSSYVQNMIENMILTSDKSYPVAS